MGGGHPREIFSGPPLEIKTCGESKIDIFKTKKRCSDSGKEYVLKRKVAKMRFWPKNGPFWDKMCGKSEKNLPYTAATQFPIRLAP